ncbi:hypothetical protein Rhopal_002214-T1 [Rhodotorula paludigena]|uniref:Uncharacterized protein n=1 Tax=Rhodotorula paludigena TaxID=86838 RepID=A0AAV5GID8_9BASI|nr:hypothetical protein Rhopal_002214-T1 [Rhodotorula paludigena]
MHPRTALSRRTSARTTASRPPRASFALAAARSSQDDLRRLEAYCHASTDRCHALENHLARLEHDLDTRIAQWDEQLASLRTVDERARELTAQLTTQLAELRSATTPRISSARESLSQSRDKVDESRGQLEHSLASIELARGLLEQLEKRLDEEETTLQRINSWQRTLVWLTCLSLALLVALISWFFGVSPRIPRHS